MTVCGGTDIEAGLQDAEAAFRNAENAQRV